MGLLRNSIKEMWRAIKDNKGLIAILFVLQIIFFASIFATQAVVQPKIMNLSMEMAEYLNDLNSGDDANILSLNASSTVVETGTGLLGKDPLMLYRNSQQIANLIFVDLLISLLCILVFLNMMWMISVAISSEEIKPMMRPFLKFMAVALIYLIPYLIILYLCLKEIILPSAEKDIIVNSVTAFLFLISIVLLYFMTISFSLVHLPFKKIFARTFFVGAKKPHLVLMIYAIAVIFIGIFSYLFYITIEMNIFLFLLTMALFLLSFVLARLFVVCSINEIEKDLE